MNTFEFLTDQLPYGYAFNFDNYLFNKIKHINTQDTKDRADYFIVNNIKKRIEGKIHFLLNENTAYSPYKSLFGSFEFSRSFHPNLLLDFWQYIENDLISRHINKVKITNFAECYADKKTKIIANTMDVSGFSIVLKAVNHHIVVGENPLESLMHPMEKRRLKKCSDNGFSFAEEPISSAAEIFNYLQTCRNERGLEVSITKDKLLEYLQLFPQNYPMFSVRRNGELAAAVIAIKVHRQILYYFLPASLRKFKQFSPSVLLLVGLYNYCQKHQMEMLDLGISTEKDGKDQNSLIDFKERMGGIKSYKYFFEKEL